MLEQMKRALYLDPTTNPKDRFRYKVFNYLLREFELAVRKVDKTSSENDHNIKTNVRIILLGLTCQIF
jgi:hypothetical protein